MTSWKVDAKGELDDSIEKLNEAQIRQIVWDMQDEESIEFVDQIKQVGAELCQAQAHVGLPPEAELILSFMEVPSIFSKLF